MSRRILVLFAHPSLHRSEANRPLLDATRATDGVTLVDLYAEYPAYRIDIEREQARLREHDVVVFMFPLYWYSTPSILKEWQDLVFEYGFAYGDDGNALHGKLLLCALTAGGSAEAYRAEGQSHYSVRELLRPIEQTARLCGLTYLPPYALYGARTAREDGRIDAHVDGWIGVLEQLKAGEHDWQRIAAAETLNDCLADFAPVPS